MPVLRDETVDDMPTALVLVLRWSVRVAVVVGVQQVSGWPFALAVLLGIVVVEALRARSVEGSAACRRCLHPHDDHHGPCQECLRITQRREPLEHAPCSRFVR